jgi:hypothetical protein
MNRSRFISAVVRAILLAMLALTGIFLGKRAVAGSDCSACSGNGICNGKSDCSTYLSKK